VLTNAMQRMMRTSFLFLLFLSVSIATFSQPEKRYSLVFYNTENLFDWKNDSLVNDGEFTPEGQRHWTYNRFQKKINNLAKVLLAAGEWGAPDIVGVCEVENRDVLERLIRDTPLKSTPYKIIHKESPDARGIDVALIYNSKTFNPVFYDYYPILNPDGSVRKTREILHVAGTFGKSDTIHIFINHWPSRYGGLMESVSKRSETASVLRSKIEEVLHRNPNSKIVILGDFNDQPGDESIRKVLKANPVISDIQKHELYNLSSDWKDRGTGTLKYRTQWFVFDQIIVTGTLLKSKTGISCKKDGAAIVAPGFLFQEDERYGGKKPFRTYNGMEYAGGFADHLPVKLLLEVN
jgi:Endonuclease/Exonuclease/phosphatase family